MCNYRTSCVSSELMTAVNTAAVGAVLKLLDRPVSTYFLLSSTGKCPVLSPTFSTEIGPPWQRLRSVIVTQADLKHLILSIIALDRLIFHTNISSDVLISYPLDFIQTPSTLSSRSSGSGCNKAALWMNSRTVALIALAWTWLLAQLQ